MLYFLATKFRVLQIIETLTSTPNSCCSRISLSSVSCSYSPNRRSGPLLRKRGFTSPVSSNIFKYRLTVRSDTLSCWPICCGEECQARAIQIIRHRKSREYGIDMTNQKTVLLLFGAHNLGQSSINQSIIE